jgi:putative membrane protein
MVRNFVLTAKGFCMGLADVIPGVSGGTMALILGIYVQFIEAIKSLNARFVKPLVGWVGSGFKRERVGPLKEAFGTIHLRFLLFLGAGIVTAFALGSKFIPSLMESYPVYMRAFFFGLILASVWVPYRMMQRRGPRELVAGLVVGLTGYLLVGLSLGSMDGWERESVAGQGTTLEALAKSVPSAMTPSQLLLLEENREALAAISTANGADDFDFIALAASSDPRHTVVNGWKVPEGVALSVPRPPYLWVLLGGFIAICAMILPGVSGSFMLLALGSYYFMLNALKGFFSGLASLSLSGPHVLYVGLFLLGLLLGLVSFSRVLSWLFRRYASITLAAMTGLMLGCLRAIWPFQVSGQNVLPDGFDGVVLGALGVCAAGIALVLVLNAIGARHQRIPG